MASQKEQIRLGAFIMATGHHVPAAPPGRAGRCRLEYRSLSRTGSNRRKRGKFEHGFVADSPAGWERAPESAALRRTAQALISSQ